MRRFTLIMAMIATGAFARGAGFEFFRPLDPPRGFQAMALGGWTAAPPNTKAALERAAQDTIEWISVDVRRTSDGVHVLCGLAVVSDAGGVEVEVARMKAAEFAKITPPGAEARRARGAATLTLAEAFAAARGKINLMLLVHDADPGQLVREIIEAGMERQTLVHAYGLDAARLGFDAARMKEGAGGKIALMADWAAGEDAKAWAKATGAQAAWMNADRLTAEIAQGLRTAGVICVAAIPGGHEGEEWVESLERASAAGAAIIASNRPEEVIAELTWKKMAARPVQISLHRGAGRYAPENTVPAFEKGIALGVEYLEFDVRPSAEGRFFILHDGKLDRTTNGVGPITEMNDAGLRGLDAGAWFDPRFAGERLPELEDFLKQFGTRAMLYFDAKDIEPEALAEVIGRLGLCKQTIVFQGAEYLARLKAIDPEIERMAPLDSEKEIEAVIAQCAPHAFDARWGLITPEFVARCHAAGVMVYSDGLGPNSSVEKYRAAIRAGIDLIQTDEPMKVMRAAELEELAM